MEADTATAAARAAEDGGGAPRAGAAPRPGGARAAHAWLDAWERNAAELARLGPDALAPARSAAASAGRGEDSAEARADDAANSASETPAGAPHGMGRAGARAAAHPDPAAGAAAGSSTGTATEGAAPGGRAGLPSPLVLHLGAAAATMATATALCPLSTDARFPWTAPEAGAGRAAWESLLAAEGAGAPLAVARAAAARLARMLEGVEAWQAHPWTREVPDRPVLWSRGAARLIDTAPDTPPGAPAALVVPSLVNRPWVMELHPARSMLGWLAARGIRPLLLDWGDPGPEERGFDLDAYVTERLAPALAAAAGAAGGPVALIGYCMGGTLAVAAAQRAPRHAARLALVGAPWAFDGLTGAAQAMLSACRAEDRATLRARLLGLGEVFGAVPVDMLQALFTALDPGLALRKFRAFAGMDPASARAELFVATEDWLADGPPLAAPTAVQILCDWYLDDGPARGAWAPGGEVVRPEALRLPTLAFCSRTDRIAPPACAEALPLRIPGARIRRPGAGHVGMIVGGSAEREVWRPLAAFLSTR